MYIDALDIAEKKLQQLQAKGLETVEDVAGYFPKKYLDFRQPIQIAALKENEVQATVGRILKKSLKGKIVRFGIKDVSGEWINVTFFGSDFLFKIFSEGDEVIIAGKVEVDNYGKHINNPVLFSKEIAKNCRIQPVYTKVPGMSADFLEKTITNALQLIPNEDYLEQEIVYDFNLVSSKKAFQLLHAPKDFNDVEKARHRIVFDKMFEYSLQMNLLNSKRDTGTKYKLTTFEYARKIIEDLPFQLTEGQSQALRSMSLKMMAGEKVDALVQGDVGCGKTLVAILMMAGIVEAGHQAILMAPTTVLAKQHYIETVSRMESLGVNIAFLSGETKKRERTKILKGIADGSIQVLVGTHSVISDELQYKSLGLMIVDEEHRFGVKVRDAIKRRTVNQIHQINMSATPIPRTLTMALYADALDVYTIKNLPNGRKKIITGLINDENRAWNGIVKEVEKGHQAYVVCPLIEESDSDLMNDVDSVDETYDKLMAALEGKGIQVGKVTGKMKPNEIAETLEAFSKNEIQVIVSTTIIEVGVNVPNSTIIVIKNAERFGLAQLHQLRGRVGRSALQSYCVLLSDKTDNQKLIAMCESTDGFYIAQKDMEIRGSGDWTGVKQSGSNPYIDLILADMDLYKKVQEVTKEIVENPIRLSKYHDLNILLDENGVLLEK